MERARGSSSPSTAPTLESRGTTWGGSTMPGGSAPSNSSPFGKRTWTSNTRPCEVRHSSLVWILAERGSIVIVLRVSTRSLGGAGSTLRPSSNG